MKTDPEDYVFAMTGEFDGRDFKQKGITMREYYAGLAMQGLMRTFGTDSKEASYLAVLQADALIKELNKE